MLIKIHRNKLLALFRLLLYRNIQQKNIIHQLVSDDLLENQLCLLSIQIGL